MAMRVAEHGHDAWPTSTDRARDVVGVGRIAERHGAAGRRRGGSRWRRTRRGHRSAGVDASAWSLGPVVVEVDHGQLRDLGQQAQDDLLRGHVPRR